MVEQGDEKKSTAKLTREYIESRPALRSILMRGLVNYTALARNMIEERGTGNEEAIVVALRRYVQESGGEGALPDQAVMALLARSNLHMKTKISRITARNDWLIMARLEQVFRKLMASRVLLQIILGTEGITIITEHTAYKEIMDVLETEHVLRTRKDLAEIAVRCPEEIEDTPGVVAHLASLLAFHGINVVEMVSCYTDIIFIVEDKDTVRAYEILQKVMGQS
jgi:aspartokinase